MTEVTKDILKKIYQKRPPVGRKYDYGLLTVIGGSEFYSGSPALSALAAMRSGIDVARVIAPKRAADIIASFTPDLAAYPLKGDWLKKEHLAVLLSMTQSAKEVSRGKSAVLIGGGAGRSEETQEVISQFLSEVPVPCVIDADAIYAVAKSPSIIADKNFILTPHTHEFSVLTGKEVFELPEAEKIKIVQEEAQCLKAIILLKGGTDIISDGNQVSLNRTGSSFMTVGGTGDTLAGIVGAILARTQDPFLAACAGAYINGLAGQIASQKLRESLMAIDVIAAIPEVLSGI